MHIAILGATSQIAKDLALSFDAHSEHQLTLFARRPEAVRDWLTGVGLAGRYAVDDFEAFGAECRFDAVLNFVGVGNPAQAAAMGASIFDVTLRYDELALQYLRAHPDCRYLFLSSGAAYGSNFSAPVDRDSDAIVPINHLKSQDWYAAAKLHAECRHRSLPDLHIVDIRVFNYFSRTQDISARFLITDILRAIRDQTVLQTSPTHMVRDYLHPSDFHQLVAALLCAPATNAVVDCYSREPIDKLSMLAKMQESFGLRYEIAGEDAGVNATGAKPYYYSRNTRAADFGYQPSLTSLEGILLEAAAIMRREMVQEAGN